MAEELKINIPEGVDSVEIGFGTSETPSSEIEVSEISEPDSEEENVTTSVTDDEEEDAMNIREWFELREESRTSAGIIAEYLSTLQSEGEETSNYFEDDAASSTLSNLYKTRLVGRRDRPTGRGYIYRISEAGEEWLEMYEDITSEGDLPNHFVVSLTRENLAELVQAVHDLQPTKAGPVGDEVSFMSSSSRLSDGAQAGFFDREPVGERGGAHLYRLSDAGEEWLSQYRE